MASKRAERIRAFESFLSEEKPLFERIADADPRHAALQRVYSFYVTPGGRSGGLDKREMELFYGQRPFDAVTQLRLSPQQGPLPSERFLIEHGARMRYLRSDNGLVTCILLPAETDAYRQREDGILLAERVEPSKITRYAPAHWRAFMAYMQCTCLEGEPSFVDRFRVFWLRSIKKLIVRRRSQESRACAAGLSIARFVLTIGLSGFVLFGLQQRMSRTDAQSQLAILRERIASQQGELTAYIGRVDAQAEQIGRLERQVASDQIEIRSLREAIRPPRTEPNKHRYR